jgi:ABC-type multidrug transport system ATPase subunit
VPAIKVESLHKKYDEVEALRSLSFSVNKGGIFGIIGADGAGKTTLLRICATLIQPDKGTAYILGKSVTRSVQSIRQLIGYMPQRFSLYQDLTVQENIAFFADVFGISGKQRTIAIRQLLGFANLDRFQKRRAAELSGGMKQKLALCCALIHKPELLLLDEPTTGVDPVSRNEFREILLELKHQGTTIVISTPYMDEADTCDDLLILHKGDILKKGTPEDLLSQLPFTLYRIESTERTVYCPRTALLPQGIHKMYPSSGAVHLMVDPQIISPEMVTDFSKKQFPEANIISETAPRIEDLFFHLVQ